MEPPYHQLDRRLACRNSRFDVYFDSVEFPKGAAVPDYMIVRPRVQDEAGIAGVLVLPEVSGRVGLMRCYRHQFSRDFWQAPAGFMEPGETAEECASRELREETGLACPPAAMVPLGCICPDVGLIEGLVALFLACCQSDANTGLVGREFGTGKLHYFLPEGFTELLMRCDQVGAATLVAGFRYLGYRTLNP